MKDSPLQLAKREMHALATRPGSWIGMSAAGIVLGIAGPFGTDEHLRLAPRLVYWLVVAVVTFSIGSVLTAVVGETLRGRGLRPWPAIIAAGMAAGIGIFAAVAGINWVVFALSPLAPGYALGLAINAVIIATIVSGAVYAIHQQIAAAATEAAGAAARSSAPSLAPSLTPTTPHSLAPSRLMARLPVAKRGPLQALSVQDHYTEVITDNGSELVLLRLGDAIAEAGDTPGLQVHRSHWVATAAVTSVRRDGAKAVLTLKNGREIPASRSYISALKEAGLLPG